MEGILKYYSNAKKAVFAEVGARHLYQICKKIARCHQLYDEDPARAPTIIFITEGVHEVDEDYLNIHYPVKIVGA